MLAWVTEGSRIVLHSRIDSSPPHEDTTALPKEGRKAPQATVGHQCPGSILSASLRRPPGRRKAGVNGPTPPAGMQGHGQRYP